MVMNTTLAHIADNKKVAVIIVGYQLLVSAKQRPLSESDDPSIDVILEYCGFDQSPLGKLIGNTFWEKSIVCNPNAAFQMVSEFSNGEKAAVKEMIQALVRKDNTYMRQDIANQLYSILHL